MHMYIHICDVWIMYVKCKIKKKKYKKQQKIQSLHFNKLFSTLTFYPTPQEITEYIVYCNPHQISHMWYSVEILLFSALAYMYVGIYWAVFKDLLTGR